jgi:phosphate starvation-inducible membrane PsiE
MFELNFIFYIEITALIFLILNSEKKEETCFFYWNSRKIAGIFLPSFLPPLHG